jgi:hypothetical protein
MNEQEFQDRYCRAHGLPLRPQGFTVKLPCGRIIRIDYEHDAHIFEFVMGKEPDCKDMTAYRAYSALAGKAYTIVFSEQPDAYTQQALQDLHIHWVYWTPKPIELYVDERVISLERKLADAKEDYLAQRRLYLEAACGLTGYTNGEKEKALDKLKGKIEDEKPYWFTTS